MKLLLIDGDILRYRCGFAAQHTHYHMYLPTEVKDGEPVEGSAPLASFENAADCKAWCASDEAEPYGKMVRVSTEEVEPVQNALHNVKHVIAGVQELWPDYHPCIYVSCPTADNWRTQFYPEYKANRKDARKPVHGPAIDEYMRKKWDVISHPTKEADDLIAEQAYDNNYTDVVVVTIDKDMLQIPCPYYHWVNETCIMQDPMSALRCLAEQRISGDSTDNIKGIPGWGEKTAKVALEQSDVVDLEDMLDNIYITAANRQGSEIFDSPEEARYCLALTTALVTLPVSDEHRERLIDGVKHAEANLCAITPVGEHTGDTSGSTQ
jgi:5'-3' exonuclease